MALRFLVRASGWVMMSFAELCKTREEGARGQEVESSFLAMLSPRCLLDFMDILAMHYWKKMLPPCIVKIQTFNWAKDAVMIGGNRMYFLEVVMVELGIGI